MEFSDALEKQQCQEGALLCFLSNCHRSRWQTGRTVIERFLGWATGDPEAGNVLPRASGSQVPLLPHLGALSAGWLHLYLGGDEGSRGGISSASAAGREHSDRHQGSLQASKVGEQSRHGVLCKTDNGVDVGLPVNKKVQVGEADGQPEPTHLMLGGIPRELAKRLVPFLVLGLCMSAEEPKIAYVWLLSCCWAICSPLEL